MYVCISLYHWPHLAAVIVPMFLCRVWSSKWVRKLLNAIPCRRAFSLLFICSCCSGRLMSAFMAAFKALMACLTMLRNGLCGGSFLNSEFGTGKAAIKADISRPEQQEQMNNREKARRQGIALGNFRTHLLLHTLQGNIRDLQIRQRVRVRLLSARGLGLSCRRHCCCRRQLATKIFQ